MCNTRCPPRQAITARRGTSKIERTRTPNLRFFFLFADHFANFFGDIFGFVPVLGRIVIVVRFEEAVARLPGLVGQFLFIIAWKFKKRSRGLGDAQLELFFVIR